MRYFKVEDERTLRVANSDFVKNLKRAAGRPVNQPIGHRGIEDKFKTFAYWIKRENYWLSVVKNDTHLWVPVRTGSPDSSKMLSPEVEVNILPEKLPKFVYP